MLLVVQKSNFPIPKRSQLRHTFRGSDSSIVFNMSECHENFRNILGGLDVDVVQQIKNYLFVHGVG